MNTASRLLTTLILSLLCLSSLTRIAQAAESSQQHPPNIVIMFADDQGYGDIGVYGAKGYETPNLDRMAAEGARFTDFYVSSPVCSASRAALLTGCYHGRVGMHGAIGPSSPIGLSHDETTIAELLKQQGYATAMFGKWHLGRPENMLPTNHGFDEYLGIPYSNDMWPYHPGVRHLPMKERLKKWPHLPLIEGTTVINEKVSPDDQRQLTTLLTERAVDFINRNADHPFFLYVPQPMPHVPLYTSDKFEGKTEQGAYGDVIAEIDWSMGQILEALKTNGLDENTLVLYTSDNGPWLSYGNHAGSSGPLREGKGTCWEGGIRVPFLARWPGQIPPGLVVSEPAATIDLLPTIAAATEATLPKNKIDGHNILPLLTGKENAKSPHKALFFYYKNNQLQAMRSGKWKLIFPHTYRTLAGREGGTGGIPVNYENHQSELELYNLKQDIGETTNVADQYPEIVAKLTKMADEMRSDLGDSLTKSNPTGAREPASLQ
ncbi:MAG: sulfatase [Verrucomicrobiota bacterium]